MKASKFSDAQKTFVLKQAEDGVPIVEVYPRHFSQAKFFNWKTKYSETLPNGMLRLT